MQIYISVGIIAPFFRFFLTLLHFSNIKETYLQFEDFY